MRVRLLSPRFVTPFQGPPEDTEEESKFSSLPCRQRRLLYRKPAKALASGLARRSSLSGKAGFLLSLLSPA